MTALEVWNNEGESLEEPPPRGWAGPVSPPATAARGGFGSGVDGRWGGGGGGGGGLDRQQTVGGAAAEQMDAHAHGLPWKPGDTVGGGQEVRGAAAGAVKEQESSSGVQTFTAAQISDDTSRSF